LALQKHAFSKNGYRILGTVGNPLADGNRAGIVSSPFVGPYSRVEVWRNQTKFWSALTTISHLQSATNMQIADTGRGGLELLACPLQEE